MAGIAFWGLKSGQKQGWCCSNARTAKTNRKTTHTLKHMLKWRKFPTDWMLKILNGVQKPSNRALNIGNNTRARAPIWRVDLALKWPRYFYSRWCSRGVPPLRKPLSFRNFAMKFAPYIYVWTIQNHNSAKKKKKNENVVPFKNCGQITDFYFGVDLNFLRQKKRI